MSKSLLVFLLAVLFAVSVSSCFRKPTAVVKNKRALHLRWLTDTLPLPTEPAQCKGDPCRQHAALTLEGLTRLELTENGIGIQPALATQWKWATPTTLVFTLRAGARWSNGEALTAQHFISSWKRLLKSGSPKANLLFPIRNARALSEGKSSADFGVQSPDPQTLILHLYSPRAGFPYVFGDPATWPSLESQTGSDANPIAIGPFRWESRKADRIVYERNPHYYNPATNVDRIEVIREPLTSTRLHLFLGGEAEMADQIPRSLISQVDERSGLIADMTSRLVALVFNTAKRPFQNVSARAAFEQAIDRDELIRLERAPHFSSGTLFPLPAGVSPPSWVVTFNASKAKELWESHLPDAETSGSRAFPRTSLQWAKGDNLEAVAENLQAQWVKNLELKVELVEGGAPALQSISLVKWRMDPTSLTGPLDSFVSDSVDNWAHWHYRPFDSLMNLIGNASDLAKARPWVSQAEAILVGQEAIVHPLYFVAHSSLRQPTLKKVAWSPLEFWDFRQATME
jgi:ABC-type oligopeptide transport system substrate-binding subunit